MSDIGAIVQVLEQSLNPGTAKSAEGLLKGLESQVGFPITLLHVVANENTPIPIRLAGALYFKNLVKRKWIDENGQYQISKTDVDMIKAEIVSLMIVLPDSLQIQIGEAISLIAESEFPDLWSGLIDELVSKLTLEDLVANKGVLKVAHSIFKRWRPLFRSDELFLEIKMVLDKFAVPFLEMLKSIDLLIDQNLQDGAKLKLLFENLLILVKIYYDLNCQDIPEFFEDHLNEGISILLKYLKFQSNLLEDASEDEEMDVVIEVKINVCELIQLYTTRYEEEYKKYIQGSIQIIWDLLNNISIQQKNDILVSKALQYMTCVVNLSNYNGLFNNEESVKQITEKIILPNIKLRESDLDMFEDDPIEYTRRDLEGSDVESRRRSTTEFLRALKESNENLVTNIMMSYINHYLKSYSENPSSNWKLKDIAIYLFCAIASKGAITNSGVTSTNLLVDVIQFFSEFIYPDLVGNVSTPILKVDSIKYIYIFRNQLTKEQLIETLPLLTSNFNDDNYVVYTYTSITIEKILSLRNPANHQQMLFNKNDLSVDVLNDLLMNLFKLIFKMGTTPEKLSENEFLMKCVMRILLISEDSNTNSILQILQELIKIVEIISKNPSNPKFSHYTFESICIILKYYQTAIQDFYGILKNTLLGILGADVQEFVPYSFQILSFVLESYPKNEEMPTEYEQLIKPLCSPPVWEFKGNIPAIKRLLSAIISFKPTLFNDANNITPILGIYQKLISSKSNDILGFEFLECIMINVDINSLRQFLNEIFIILLTRLKSFKTDKFVKRFIIFISKLSSLELKPALNKNQWNSTIVIRAFEGIQSGLFEQISNNFILPNISKFNNLTDKKILVVGLTNLIVENYKEINSSEILKILGELLKLLNSDSITNYKTIDENAELMAELDNDDFTFGSSFNRLNTIQSKPLDPISNNIKDKNMLIEFFKMKLQSIDGQYLQGILQQLDPECSAIVHALIM